MIISDKYNFILVLPPRTASRSMSSALHRFADKKHGISEFHPRLKQITWDYSNYFTAGFVRNPVDRIMSLFLKERKKKMKHLTFLEFLEIWRGKLSNSSKWQLHKFLKGVDHIYHYENLPDSWNQFCADVGLNKISLPHIGLSKKRSEFEEHVTEEALNIIFEIFEKDIELFNFKIGDRDAS